MPRPSMLIRNTAVMLSTLAMSGCMTLSEQPTASSSCAAEKVWDASVAALKDFPFQTMDKDKGILETAWMEVEASTQAGALQRDVNKERLRYVVEVKPEGVGAAAAVLQLREEWTPMGVRSRQWRAIQGSSSEEEAVATTIGKRLKEKGC